MNKHLSTIVQRAILAAAIALSATASAQVSIHPSGDVFDEAPPAATTRGERACEPARRYVDLIAAERYDQLGTLFADDAVFVTPVAGKVLHGPAEIVDFYQSFLPTIKPRIVPISFIADGDECVMELVAAANTDNYSKYRLGAIDHFTVNKEGKIRHMVVFLRPESIKAQQP